MQAWQAELLDTLDGTPDESTLRARLGIAAAALGFEHFAYGLRLPWPLAAPRTVLLSTYPAAWQQRYHQQGYLATDPSVAQAQASRRPLVWSDTLFAATPQLWSEAQSFGLRFGWAQSCVDGSGVAGMLTLARRHEALSPAELAHHAGPLRWLVHTAHWSLSRLLREHGTGEPRPSLTAREVEVLRWTADGKTASEIADLLKLSDHTVQFHLKNAIAKLHCANKTAATVRAALLGLLA